MEYEELLAEVQEKRCICELCAFGAGYKGFSAPSHGGVLWMAVVSSVRRIFKDGGENAVECSAWINMRFIESQKITELS